MLELRDIPLFASLSNEALHRLQPRLSRRRYAEGEVILRAGDPAREMHVLVDGVARVELGEAGATGRRAIWAAAGQTLGEMSVLSHNAVSATVVAQREVVTLAITAEDLSQLLASEPSLYQAISAVLIDRLRHRTDARAFQLQPGLALLAVDPHCAAMPSIVRSLAKGVTHYSPGSELLDAASVDRATLAARIDRWRHQAAGDQFLIIATPADLFADIHRLLLPGDAALRITADVRLASSEAAIGAGPAELRAVLCNARQLPQAAGPWIESIMSDEVVTCCADSGPWVRSRYPVLDRLVRFITYREVGIAMSAGAAGGFAHLGFLDVLEQSGVPIDFTCGSSMGGAVALCFSQFGTVSEATDALCRLGAEFARSRGLQILPRSGLVSQRRMRQIAEELFGGRTFADLTLPVAVVAADLVGGQRVILDRGPIAPAARATVAIPGLIPPVRFGNRILVDGGLVTRVPADLLGYRRCGLRIATVVVPLMAESEARRDEEAERLQMRLDQPFGFRAALGASWKLLGWWDSAAQAQKADIVIKIGVQQRDGFDFAAGRRIVEVGRQATLMQVKGIRAAVDKLLTPGTP
jgi:NTE family protein